MAIDSQIKKHNYDLYKRLLWEASSLWKFLVISVIGSIVYSSCDAYAMYLIKPLLNKGINDRDVLFLKKIALLFLLLFSLRGCGSFLSSFFIGKVGVKIVCQFRKKMFVRFLDLPANFYDKISSGKVLSKILYNVDQVTNATSSAIITVIQDGTFVIGLIVVMIVSSWQLSITILIVAPFVSIFISWISKKFRKYSHNTQDAMSNVTHLAEEALANYKEIRVFGGQNLHEQHFNKIIGYTYKQQIKTLFLDSLSSPVIQFIGAIIISVVLIIVATFGIQDGGWLDAGGFVAFFASMLAILKPIKNLTSVNSTIQKAIAATEDIFNILDHEKELDDGKKEIFNIQGNVFFKKVFFRYSGNSNDTLQNITLEVKRGETVALVGRSGSGKSTLVNLLSRFYNIDCGNIFLENTDIKELKLNNLRSHISIVSQHVNLFDDNIFNNIAYGKSEKADENDIINVAKISNAWSFIEKLPNGLYTKVGQNGLSLSGGQRQRIAIARALLKNAPILILDEATSSLDNESEKLVQQALNKLIHNRTTFIVAHRLSTIEHADKIVVMDGGSIIEIGTHDQLMKNNNLYYKLYENKMF